MQRKQWAEAEKLVCVYLGGLVAQRMAGDKARNPDSWSRVRQVNSRIRTAFHEAGHVCVARLYQWSVDGASVVPDLNRIVVIGRNTHVHSLGHAKVHPIGWAPPVGPDVLRFADAGHVARHAMLIAPEMTWWSALRTVHRLKTRTEAILDAHWPELAELAEALEASGTLTGAEIEQILARQGRCAA